MQKLVDLKAMAYRFLVVPVAGVLGLGGYGEEEERNSFWCSPIPERCRGGRILSETEKTTHCVTASSWNHAAGHHGDVRRGKRSGRPSAGTRRGRKRRTEEGLGVGARPSISVCATSLRTGDGVRHEVDRRGRTEARSSIGHRRLLPFAR